MKTLSLAVLLTALLTGCNSTTTVYKAKSLGWDRVIEAKSIAMADSICADHMGYFKSSQYEQWHDYNHGNYYEYKEVDIVCYDGMTVKVPIQQVMEVVSPRVGELLRQFEKEDQETEK